MKQHNNIPPLRFSGFDGEWEEKQLGEISKDVFYGMNAAAKPFDGKNKYLRITDISEKSREFFPNPLSSPEGALFEKYKLKEGDIVFARTGASVGKSYLYKEEDGILYFAGFLIKFSIKNGIPKFIFAQTLLHRYLKWVQIMSMRSGQPGINAEEYKALPVFIPSLSEQQKIAQFLTAIDKRIQLLTRKKEQLELYKKGAMQKIFNREIRFKDENGREFPEWEEKMLGELFKFLSTNSFTRDNLNYKDGNVKNIHYGDIHTKFKTLFYINRENVPFINKDVDLSKIPDENYLKEGDVIIADASEDYDDIGKAIEIINTGNERVLAGLHTILARRLDESISVGFSGYLFKNNSFRIKVKRIAQGAKVLGLSSKRVGELTVLLPIKAEQQKIAQFLSSLDKKIEHTGGEIEKMKEWKRGLLQKMFV